MPGPPQSRTLRRSRQRTCFVSDSVCFFRADSGRSGTGYGELRQSAAVLKLIGIDVPARFELCKSPPGGRFVPVYLPTAGAFAVFPFVFNESHHIGQWIAEKQADLMGAALPGGFLRQPAQRLLGI